MIAKFGWDEAETRLYNSMIGNAGILGILTGSILGGPIINYSRRNSVFIMNAVVLVGVGISLILTLPTILIGRFIIGFTGGVFNMITSKCVYECVNEKLNGMFGCLTNCAICFGGIIVGALGLALPMDAEDQKDDELWRLVYGFPIVFAVLQTLFFLTVFRWEPIDFSIQRGDDESALKFLDLLYNPPKSYEREPRSVIFKAFVKARREEFQS